MRLWLRIEVPYDLQEGEDLVKVVDKDQQQFRDNPDCALEFAHREFNKHNEAKIEVFVGK